MSYRFRENYLVHLLATASVLIHLYTATSLGFHRDELLYLAQAAHPAWGYLSVPPLTAWLIAIWTEIFGTSLFAVRALPALWGYLYVLAVAHIARQMGGGSYVRAIAALGALIMPVSLRAFGLLQPVPLDMLMWALITACTIKFMNNPSRTAALLLGSVAGLGLLNKYTALLWLFALLLALAFSRNRSTLLLPNTALAAGVALLLITPNIFWQWQHNWPFLRHMRALAQDQLVHVDRLDILTEQLFIQLAAIPIIIAGIVWLLRRAQWRFLLLANIFTMVVLLLLRGKPYYFAGAYAPLLAAGGVAIANQVQATTTSRAAELLRAGAMNILPATLLLITAITLPLAIPILPAISLRNYFESTQSLLPLDVGLTDERGQVQQLPQDYADMLGWDELARKTAVAYHALGSDTANTIIYTENYGQASALALLGKHYGLPQPVSFHESWLLWSPATLPSSTTTFFYINDEVGEDVAGFFAKLDTVGRISVPLSREAGTLIVRCHLKPGSNINTLYVPARESRSGF